MSANGHVPAPAPRGRGAVANVASETAALVKPDALASDLVEHTLQGLAAHHSPAAWLPADGEVSQVLEHLARGLLDELASQEPTTQVTKPARPAARDRAGHQGDGQGVPRSGLTAAGAPDGVPEIPEQGPDCGYLLTLLGIAPTGAPLWAGSRRLEWRP